MIDKNIHFLLVPDSNARRATQTLLLASSKPVVGVMVGTWLELLNHLSLDYKVLVTTKGWTKRFKEIVADMPCAFWAKSFISDPDSTTQIIEENFITFMCGLTPSQRVDGIDFSALDERTKSMVDDFVVVYKRLDGLLPDELALIKEIMAKTQDHSILRKTHIYIESENLQLNSWQKELVSSVNLAVDIKVNEDFSRLLNRGVVEDNNKQSSALSYFQNNLYTDAKAVAIDDSVCWIGARDYLQEVELVAGSIQKQCDADDTLSYPDFSLLIPQEDHYVHAVHSIFYDAGLPISGLVKINNYRDVARETVLNFLQCLKKPAPVMSMADFLTSPLMPWDEELGIELAKKLMDGRYSNLLPKNIPLKYKKALALVEKSTNLESNFSQLLIKLKEVLDNKNNAEYLVNRALKTIDDLLLAVSQSPNMAWADLIKLVKPEKIKNTDKAEFIQEGISIFTESKESFCDCQHLYVLGFNQGSFPRQASVSQVFNQASVEQLNKCSFELLSNEQKNEFYKKRFLRQLNSATQSCTFLMSRMNADGTKKHASDSLVYMHSLLKGVEEPDQLILDVDRSSDLSKLPKIALSTQVTARSEWKPQKSDLTLNSNLLVPAGEDNIRPLSPSRMEDLMVSPFAWLLSWLSIEPIEWSPEKPNVLDLGSLAHSVFEYLFVPEQELPNEQQIIERTPSLLQDAMKSIAPYMLAQQWEVERFKLMDDIIKSAIAWKDVLESIGASVIDNEIWLKGEYCDVPIRGQADSIIQLANKQLVVVDYKKSGLSNREPRMQKGYDCQATLYREMIKSGEGLPDGMNLDNVEILYYLMNSQNVVSENEIGCSDQVAGWVAIKSDVSKNAMTLIRQRIAEIKSGKIILNTDEDETFFDKKAGMKKVYALDRSPLISLFMKEKEGVA